MDLLLQHLACHNFFFVTVWLTDSLATGLIDLAVCYYTNLNWGFGTTQKLIYVLAGGL